MNLGYYESRLSLYACFLYLLNVYLVERSSLGQFLFLFWFFKNYTYKNANIMLGRRFIYFNELIQIICQIQFS